MPFLGVIGAVASAAGSIAGGVAGQEQANYQAQIAQRNAIIAGQKQAQTIQIGQQRAAEQSLAGAQKLGHLKASMAANGVDINTGSAVDVRGSQRMANTLDAQTVLFNARDKAWGYGVESYNYAAQAQADKAAGRGALLGGILGGVGSLAGAAGNFFSPSSGGGGIAGSASPVDTSNTGGDVAGSSSFYSGASAGPDWTDYASAHSGFA